MADKEREPPGLKSIRVLREDRTRGKYSRPTSNLLLAAVVGIAGVLGIYHFVSERQLDGNKDALLQKERAVAATIGAEWTPLRDKIEAITLEDAKAFRGDFVDHAALSWDFRSMPGIYLRVRTAEARDVNGLRKAASASLKDGFTGCLLREANPALSEGAPDAGAFADQPWNLRQAYDATRILTPEWIDAVKESGDGLRLRVFEQQYDVAVRDQIPLAIDMIKRAQFLLLVLDEDVVDAAARADGGAIDEEALQLVAHPARVHVVNLKDGREILRLRRTGSATFMMAGEHAVTDPETRDAMQRQVNNCSLAIAVRTALAEANKDASKDAKADGGAATAVKK